MQELKRDLQLDKISKPEYIKKMHRIHERLFEYAEFIKDTDIASIQITDNGVMMTSRKSGIKMLCDEDDERQTPVEILNFGEYETEEMDFILNYIRKNNCKDFTFVDIGGNIGWYSVNIAKAFPDIRIYTFEPIPRTYSYLQENLRLNRIGNVVANNLGIADEDKELTFYYYREGSGNASLSNLSERDDTEKVKVRVTRLDDFVKKNKIPVHFIKCDVEGAELFVFRGAANTLKKYKPVVLTEMLRKWAAKFNYHPNDLILFFRKLGYECFTISGKHLKPFIKMDEYTLETNFIFIHPDTVKI